MKIAVYTVALNEIKNAPFWPIHAQEADFMFVADTGSTDGTQDMLQRMGVEVVPITVKPWRFDDARNTALALLPADIDVCISMDMDERLERGWREKLEAAWEPGVTKIMHTYHWSHDKEGKPNYTFMCDRIHARTGYHWRYPAHEATYPSRADFLEKRISVPEIVMHHWPLAKDRSSILPRLRQGMLENPTSTRMMHYLGRELMYKGMYAEALTYLERYHRTTKQPFPWQDKLNTQYIKRCLEALKD